MKLLIGKSRGGLVINFPSDTGSAEDKVDALPQFVKRGESFFGIKYAELVKGYRSAKPGEPVEFPDEPTT